MKIAVTCVKVYDMDDLYEGFDQYMDDHPKSFTGLTEYIIDQFIHPNFDSGTDVTLEIVGK